MTREELIEALSDMRDYHVVSQKCCDFLKLNLLKKTENYNAGSDFRMSGYFNYLSPTEEGFSAIRNFSIKQGTDDPKVMPSSCYF